jgi:AraC-like DNA-binding protein/tetratricopeptide (TPR) repeat protein
MKMDRDQARKLRDQAAVDTLLCILADRERVSVALRPLLVLIAAHLFDKNFDVNALWRESGLNKEMSAPFEDELGTTPWVYITERRLEVGARLLVTTQLKIHWIATVLGHTTFSKAFRRWSGQSPSEYRRNPPDDGKDERRVEAGTLHSHEPRKTDDIDDARRRLSQADAVLCDEEIRELAARLGLSSHERAATRLRDGDVDRACEDLTLATQCYHVAGDLPTLISRRRRHLGVAWNTDEALSTALCPACRTTLYGPAGRILRRHLRQALLPLPRNLEWFTKSCDPCYRIVWAAVCRARLGFMSDAWKAWWLSENVDPLDHDAPPSQGRILAALAVVERQAFGDPRQRMRYCDVAVDDAVAIGNPLLEAGARIWRGNVLGVLSRFTEARTELAKTLPARGTTPWLDALQDRMSGVLKYHTNKYPEALELLRSATGLYEILDPHLSGLLKVQQGGVHFFTGRYEESVPLNQEALSLFDTRRDPLQENAVVPINLAVSFALLGRWEEAESALSRCRFDRQVELGLAATEVFTRACLELLRGRAREALSLFAEAKVRFERLHRQRAAALAASYSVEAYAHLNDYNGALENTTAALRFFQAARCPQDTLDALGKLRALLTAKLIDVAAVAASVRSLARRHGGWLPESELK